jgi:two-component system sensor histidine kinase QseC
MVPLVDALNGLFDRIARMVESERRFTADAAHELRTPIAAIRAQAQVALGESDQAQRRHALEATLEGCDRATRLVEQLLTLSRLEAGAVPAAPAQLDLADLARRVVSEAAPQAIRRRQAIEMQGREPCLIPGDAILLAVLVRNLIDNAIRYSPPGARVNVSVAGGAGAVVLRVEDSGPGMTSEEIARLGERFFRVLGTGQGGSGLGWSIVRRIAALHRATVEVRRSGEAGGLAVEIGFPTARIAVHPPLRSSGDGVEATQALVTRR